MTVMKAARKLIAWLLNNALHVRSNTTPLALWRTVCGAIMCVFGGAGGKNDLGSVFSTK